MTFEQVVSVIAAIGLVIGILLWLFSPSDAPPFVDEYFDEDGNA